MSRTYNIKLECGCLISLDGGGGLIPCCHPGYGATNETVKRCETAWEKYKKSPEYKKHDNEIKRRNG